MARAALADQASQVPFLTGGGAIIGLRQKNSVLCMIPSSSLVYYLEKVPNSGCLSSRLVPGWMSAAWKCGRSGRFSEHFL